MTYRWLLNKTLATESWHLENGWAFKRSKLLGKVGKNEFLHTHPFSPKKCFRPQLKLPLCGAESEFIYWKQANHTVF